MAVLKHISPFLISALDEKEWSASLPFRFNPWNRAPGTHWRGGWVGLRAVMVAVEWKIISCLCRELNPDRPAARYTD
jgi:hypothetical protein